MGRHMPVISRVLTKKIDTIRGFIGRHYILRQAWSDKSIIFELQASPLRFECLEACSLRKCHAGLYRICPTNSNENGFSLIDLMIAISLLGILTLSSSFTNLHSAKLRNESRALQTFLEQSLLLALRYEEQVDISFLSSSYMRTRNQHTPALFETKALPASIQFSITSIGKSAHLYPSGVASPLTVTLKEGSASCSISLSLRGRSKLICN